MENVLQRNLKANRARKCILKYLEPQIFWKCTPPHPPLPLILTMLAFSWVPFMYILVCPKKLLIHHWVMLLYYPLVILTLWKMLMLRLFLWYMVRKRHILLRLIIWAILVRIYAERCFISTRLPDGIWHPVFISLVRGLVKLNSGKLGWNNTATTVTVSLGYSFIRLGDQLTNIDPNNISIIDKYIYNCYTLDSSSTTSFEALRLRQFNMFNMFKYTKRM